MTLTPQQSAEVAREVIGDASEEHPWDPENEAWQWQMLVEWLADKIEELRFCSTKISQIKMYELFSDVMLAVKAKDTNKLQRMVLELKGES